MAGSAGCRVIMSAALKGTEEAAIVVGFCCAAVECRCMSAFLCLRLDLYMMVVSHF